MRLYFTEYSSDMARFITLRDMESRTAPQESEFATLLAELEANEASVGLAVDTLREISGATYVIVSDTEGAGVVKDMVDEAVRLEVDRQIASGEIGEEDRDATVLELAASQFSVEEVTINYPLNGAPLYNYYLSLF